MAGKLLICRGLPASGKSQWAKSEVALAGAVRVNKDDIRGELFQKTWNFDKEKEVLRVRDFRISEALNKGKYVISDDTNFAPKHEVRLRELAKKYKSTFEIKDDFLSIPLMECIRRDKARDERGEVTVGEKVIRDMAETYLTPDQLADRLGEPQLFLDLDGVFADFDGFIEAELGIVNNRENEDPNFWDKARAYKGRLYYDMKPLPWAKELWKELMGLNPIILTGCPWSIATAADDKRQWVAEQLDDEVEVVCCKSRNKSKYAKPGDVILDDWTKYKDLWEAKGGKFIHFTGRVTKSVLEVKEALKGG